MALFSKTSGLIPNRRRGEWNALLLVMFALLAVAPSVLSAAPLRAGVSQPQAVWQWLQSPEGAPTRDLIARSLKCGITNSECGIDNPLSHHASVIRCLLVAELAPAYSHFALRISHSELRAALSPHEAAFLSGTRTNSYLE